MDNDLFMDWSADPSVVVGVGLACFAYTFSARRLASSGDAPGRGRVLLFAAAVAVVLVALTSPLHVLSERYLFTAHMAQHLLLTMAMPPLLLASLTPGMIRPLLRLRWVRAVARRVTAPVPAFLGANLVFLIWHLPQLYDAALRGHNIHIVSHLLFMSTAIVLWWPLLSPTPELPRIGYAARMLYVFAQVLPGMFVGGMLVNAQNPLYALYAEAPRITSLSPVQDQQMGALLMWVGGGVFWLIVLTVVFFAWAGPDISRTYGPPVQLRRR